MATGRKPRHWAATTATIPSLGPGAKRLASISAVQLARAPVAKCVKTFCKLLADERTCKLRQGDLLIELIDRHRLRAIDIARQTRQRPSDLSQMYQTCKMFPPRMRRKAVPYNHYFLAMRMVRKFKTLNLSPAAVLGEIGRLGFTQHRDVTAHFAAQVRRAESALPTAPKSKGSTHRPFNMAYHAPFQTLLSVFPDNSIKVLHVDPPYLYPKQTKGRYPGTSARSLACDNRDAADAINVVIDMLRDWQCKLAADGVLLLWQAAGPLSPLIMSAIDQHRWDVDRVVIWDKGRPQPGDLGSAYATQTEWLWVLKRPGDRLLNHDASPRGDVLRFPPVSMPSLAGMQQHAFEKPLDLCRFLVGKHSHPGELVFDCCGCTGSMSVSAIEMGRQWVYAESNAANYALGNERIARKLAHCQAAAG